MIENLRGRSTETKYGRAPLWLYETGVGLQAIATYTWLHGRYGHYERVMPSYATLAKELGVSRGSVIAYVKALTSVGAVRIETSGAAGRQTNLYVIAFNEPFEVTGQNADHPSQNADPVVSGVYPTGQRADGGGQPVVQEEDVSTKTFEEDKDLSLPFVPTQRPEPDPVVAEEREIFSVFEDPNPNPTHAAPLPGIDAYTAHLAAAAAQVPAPRHSHQQPQEALQTPRQPPPTPTPTADAADRIIGAYTAILGRPLLTRTRSTLHHQATEALASGYPEAWLTDRARELAAHGWTDLAKHIEKSTAPLPGTAPSTAPSAGGLPAWCGECGGRMAHAAASNPRWRTINGRPDGKPCPRCHPDTTSHPTSQRIQHGNYQPYKQPTPEERAADLRCF